ncbi:hypothetical protein [Pseudomonas sp.]|uniref:hypothetical protein n=1 Tax=Pseudomonas sp. TaxID=306 RepID=UPI00258B1B9B|nr:hypothetical protein [Pseudomonas sp.]
MLNSLPYEAGADSQEYDVRVPEVNYSSQMLVRKVRQNGSKKWKGAKAFVSESLVGEALELQEMEDDVWDVYLCKYLLGRLKSGENRLSTPQKRKGYPRFCL